MWTQNRNTAAFSKSCNAFWKWFRGDWFIYWSCLTHWRHLDSLKMKNSHSKWHWDAEGLEGSKVRGWKISSASSARNVLQLSQLKDLLTFFQLNIFIDFSLAVVVIRGISLLTVSSLTGTVMFDSQKIDFVWIITLNSSLYLLQNIWAWRHFLSLHSDIYIRK